MAHQTLGTRVPPPRAMPKARGVPTELVLEDDDMKHNFDLRSALCSLLLCSTVALAATACTSSDDETLDTEAVAPAPAVLAQTKPDPNGTYFAEVVANGTGCPAGTWNTRISSDGLVFTTTFSAYEARINAGVEFEVRDCQLAIKLHTPGGYSFSVQSFSYTGYAFLQQGVTGRQLATYYFQGTPVQSPAGRTDLVGPYDQDYLFKDDVDIEDTVWSPCGVQRDLMINTRVLLQQTSKPGASGYMNLTAADGSSLIVKLGARRCDSFGNPVIGEPQLPVQPPPVQPPPAATTKNFGQTNVLPIDDFANGGLLLAQSTNLASAGTLRSLSFYVTQLSGSLRLGLYDATGPSGGPGNKLAESAEIKPVIGWNTASVRAVSLAKGKYWLAYLPSSNDLHFRRGGENSGENLWYSYPYGPLPQTFSRTPIRSTDHWSFYGTVSQ